MNASLVHSPVIASLVVCSFAPSGLALQQTMFGPPTLYPAGTHPYRVAAGDLNGDANVDIVVNDRGPDDVHVYFGDGAGNLSGPTTYDVGPQTSDVRLGDFDLDGDLDVALAQRGRLTILFNDGTGVLGPAVSNGVGGDHVGGMAVGNLDGDDFLDACVTLFYEMQVTVLKNDGAGSFAITGAYGLPDNGRDVALGHLNGDGFLDMVATTNDYGVGDTVSVFLGDGQGGFGPRTDFPAGVQGTESLDLGDLDGDGFVDVAVVVPGHVRVLYGDGLGGLGAPTLLTSPAWLGGPTDVHAADFDGDARLDLAVSATDDSSGGGGLVTIFSDDPPGGFENDGDYPLAGDTHWGGLWASDLNSDGFSDLVAANYVAGTISVLLHSGTDCNGNGLYDPEEIEDGLAQDCDGNGLVDSCEIADNPALDLNGNGVLDECECFVATYCQTSPNSVGPGATIGAIGQPSISTDDFVLTAHDCPASQFGILFHGPEQQDVSFGDGVLCVERPMVRLPVVATNGNGAAAWPLALGGFTAGQMRYFQFWYRDPAAGGAGFNLTDALEVTFCE